ncbi:MAG: hypothetical protein KGQ93_13255 [Cyanobacteria bacterium REEB459]|nr:hypothetical protein [Cyanobacteria bacterium REEB459]MEB3312874.1 hypothetical protein [Cyanobacteriota bacterium]
MVPSTPPSFPFRQIIWLGLAAVLVCSDHSVENLPPPGRWFILLDGGANPDSL